MSTGESDSSLYYCRREEWAALLICCNPSDLVERVPDAENDQLYRHIEAYSTFKKKKKKRSMQHGPHC